jgi:sortase (surface protein transpeptidase)
MTGVGLDGQRHLLAPAMSDRNLVGWYRDGVTPGAMGDAIAVGHVDNHTGPAVFYRLSLVRTGDTIEVVRADRHTAVFTVDAVRTYRKDAFPDSTVYGDTTRPELHLITCGGHFNHKAGYDSNVVVFAHLTAVR